MAKSQRGGARPGAGRKPIAKGKKMVSISFALQPVMLTRIDKQTELQHAGRSRLLRGYIDQGLTKDEKRKWPKKGKGSTDAGSRSRRKPARKSSRASDQSAATGASAAPAAIVPAPIPVPQPAAGAGVAIERPPVAVPAPAPAPQPGQDKA